MKVNLQYLWHEMTKMLESAHIETPELDSRILIEEALNISTSSLLFGDTVEISTEKRDILHEYIKKRKNGWPISYILHTKEFMSLDFYVEPGYFTPRPDTEHLVETTLSVIKNTYVDTPIQILDYATGTGAVGISIAYYAPEVKMSVYDDQIRAPQYVDKAMSFVHHKQVHPFLLPQVNAVKMEVEDQVTCVTKEEIDKAGIFDIIVSNPPYIPSKELDELSKEVLIEPIHALDGGKDGLMVYGEIFEYASTHLKEQGHLIFEIGYHQGEDLVRLFTQYGYKDIQIYKDYGKLDRVAIGKKNSI